MSQTNLSKLRLSESDLDFLVHAAHPEAKDKYKLKQVIKEDERFRESFIEDEKVFRRVVSDEEVFLRISPPLFLRFFSERL